MTIFVLYIGLIILLIIVCLLETACKACLYPVLDTLSDTKYQFCVMFCKECSLLAVQYLNSLLLVFFFCLFFLKLWSIICWSITASFSFIFVSIKRFRHLVKDKKNGSGFLLHVKPPESRYVPITFCSNSQDDGAKTITHWLSIAANCVSGKAEKWTEAGRVSWRRVLFIGVARTNVKLHSVKLVSSCCGNSCRTKLYARF